MAFTFRPGTVDKFVYDQVVGANEYGLPRSFRAEDSIIDIGAHIGSFSYAVYLRGCRNISAWEANPENAQATLANLHGLEGGITLTQRAVWRSDIDVPTVQHTGFSDIIIDGVKRGVNTGGGNVLWDNGAHIEVPTTKFDDIIRTITQNGQEIVRLVKIDAETSEFPILLTSTQLGYVAEIVGEYHEVGGDWDTNTMPPGMQTGALSSVTAFTADVLRAYLTDHGFEFTEARFRDSVYPSKWSNMGIFRAWKPALVAKMTPGSQVWRA